MSDSTVELGEITFDPVGTQDFRLSVEGTSGAGKSNTLAVVLEDLADVPIPTLIIERVGALSTVRLEDDDIIVVGARQEEGIDLAVGLQDLDKIGGWVLDRGMKILVDISTYSDHESEKSRVHLAAANAIQSLNDRAHEKYRSGDRTKSLLVIDEAHWLAPKDNAPEPDPVDEYIKRCRGQIIKASTEGGNKGISSIVAYQRRAFLHNGTLSLCRDYIAHEPPGEDVGRTAGALRCGEDALMALGTGEILVRGENLSGGELVGPTKVRKRRSPDPREESFELPEPPEDVAGMLEELQESVEMERERRTEREEELERLREENERLRRRKEELEQELANVDNLASALERLGGGNGGGAAEEVGEGVADLQERVEELKRERDQVEDGLEEVRGEKQELLERKQELEGRVGGLEADVQELRSAFDRAAEDVRGLAEVFEVDLEVEGLGMPAEAVDGESELREEVERLRRENQRLRNEGLDMEPLEDYEEFLKAEPVRNEIEEAKKADITSPRYIKGVLAAIIAEKGPVGYDEIAERLGLAGTGEVSKAATELESRKVINKDRRDDGMYVDLNIDGINEVRAAAARRQQTEELMEGI